MPPVRSVSVLIPTYQGIEFLDRVLGALATQDGAPPWDLWIVDSGSTDGTWECLQGWRTRLGDRLHLRRIDPVEFDHGDTRNQLAAWSSGELLVFLTQDAIPVGRDWLARLAANFEDEEVAAAYCRNLPRPDAGLLTRLFSERDPGYRKESERVRLPSGYESLDAHARRLLYNFNDVASALRRSWWERHPFPRTWFGEDVLMARALLEAGATIVYDAEAPVEHSHDYDEHQTYARARIDGRFNAEWLGRICIEDPRAAVLQAERTLVEDEAALKECGLAPAELERALARAYRLRLAAFQGLCAGGRSERRRPTTRVLEDPYLSVLMVVHGFPPDTWAGTEVYTLNLALELMRRGHRVTLLTRAPAAGDEEDFSLREEEFSGLRVLRMTHRLAHERLAESYRQPKAHALFEALLDELEPDLVHFQHLIHTSIDWVALARDRGLATVITCHDYWALCPRVQLIRPDGERCSENMGAGCLLCVKEEHLDWVPALHRLSEVGGGPLEGLARDLAGAGGGAAASAPLRIRQAQEYLDLMQREKDVPAAYAECDLRISPSRFLRKKYLESGAFDPHTFLFSDNGMRTDHVRALEKSPSPGHVRFGFVGSLVWYKGGRVLLEAFARLSDAPCSLRIYGAFDPGSDPHHAELAALAGENVTFMGRFDNDRLSEVYAEIDVLVVPSLWYENSPITIHEAWLTHTPVVTGDIGGMAEFVRDGIDGLHFVAGDAEDLSRVLRRFCDEPDLLERLSRDFPRVKTIEENAAEMEFRYRALCCISRPSGGRHLDLPGHQTARRQGPVEPQGAELLLLRPGGASVEYDLAVLGAGPARVSIEILALGNEPTVEHAGRVLLGGDEIGTIPPFRAGGRDELRPFEFRAQLPPRARLRVEANLGEDAGYTTLRIARVQAWEEGR